MIKVNSHAHTHTHTPICHVLYTMELFFFLKTTHNRIIFNEDIVWNIVLTFSFFVNWMVNLILQVFVHSLANYIMVYRSCF